MRRLLVFALATAAATSAALGVAVAPASAHICPIPAEIPVGKLATIDVGVTVEDATVPDVTITVPGGLRLDRVDNKPGWTATRSGSAVRYRGGPIVAFTCEYFSLGVTAPSQGAFGIPVVQRSAAGKVVARTTPDPNSTSDRVLDQFVYAGVKPPKTKTGSKGLSVTTIAGIAIVGFGIVMFAALRIRARRTEHGAEEEADARDAELHARLDEFKKRAPDPPPQP